MLNFRLNLMIFFLLGTLGILQYRLWSDSGGLKDLFRLKHRLSQQAQENESLKKRNEELLLQIQSLKNNAEAMESRARGELGMIKKNETFYQIVPGTSNENLNQ